jgi:hypothetical protein
VIQIVISHNSQQMGCVYRIVKGGEDITHQTPHSYVRLGQDKVAKREPYDWSTQGSFASELALALNEQPFFWECHDDRPVEHVGKPPRHVGYAYWVTPGTTADTVYLQLLAGAIKS